MPNDPASGESQTVLIQLQRTLASKSFVNSQQLCRLLRYIVESELSGRGDELKESVLALEVFRRETSFDPRADTVVRTEVRRLRQKLAEYYQDEGRDDEIEFVLPKGGYRAVFRWRTGGSGIEATAERRKRVWIVVSAAALIVAATALSWRWFESEGRAPGRVSSIAVIPLENLSGDPAQEYFSDGLTDALCTDLAKIRALSVISRTTAMRYKGSQKPVPEIGRELKVDYVVGGTVTRMGERVRITAQLIAAASDRHLWAESYERPTADVLGVQAEIARAIAKQVNIRLTPEEQARLEARAVGGEARDLYLRGRFNWETRETVRLERSVEEFKRAIALEPGYALAYAGLADSYSVLAGRTDRADLVKLACETARKAITLDENLGEAHAQVATACTDDWEWREREQGYRRAIDLSPSYATAHTWFGGHLIRAGRLEEGLSEIRRAAELDPLSPNVNEAMAWALYTTRNYDGAIAHISPILDIFPGYPQGYFHMGLAYAGKGNYKEALQWLERGVKVTNGAPDGATLVAHVKALAGDSGEARRLLAELREREGTTPVLFAVLYMDIGDKDHAFEWLDRAVTERSRYSNDLKVEPLYDSLHRDPRWSGLMRKMNLSN